MLEYTKIVNWFLLFSDIYRKGEIAVNMCFQKQRQARVSGCGKETKYILMGKVNDGIRIYVDGKKRVDYWEASYEKL